MSTDQTEIAELRKIVANQVEVIDHLNAIILKTHTPMPEVDLNKVSIDAGTYYIEKKFKGAPITETQLVLNSVAHGFFMGYRKAEETFNALQTTEVEND